MQQIQKLLTCKLVLFEFIILDSNQLEECKKNLTWIMKHKNNTQKPATDATVNFQKGDLIGSGIFGSVYQGLSATGQIIAVKCLPFNEEDFSNSKKSINTLRSLTHPNIVKYIDAVYQKDTLDVLMEYAPAGSIKTVVQNFGALNEKVMQVYTRQILNGLMFLHSKEIIHKDLKASNVLVDNEAIIKLTDFGFSEILINKLKASSDVKPMWLAPEYFVEKSKVTEAFDIWSLGILIIEVLTAKELKWESIPVDSASTEKQIFAILPHNLSFNCKLFVQNCLIYNPNHRANMRDLLSHPFLTVTNVLEKKYALEQIKKQLHSLSIFGS